MMDVNKFGFWEKLYKRTSDTHEVKNKYYSVITELWCAVLGIDCVILTLNIIMYWCSEVDHKWRKSFEQKQDFWD